MDTRAGRTIGREPELDLLDAALVALGPGSTACAGTVINVLAVAWLAFETVNIAWPRRSLAPSGAPGYQIWAAPIVLGIIAVAGLAYLVVARPQRRLADRAGPSRAGSTEHS
jgi:hypothetical protein